MKRIAITGCPGSGKSTLAQELTKHFNLPVYRLDDIHWLPGWQRREKSEFEKLHDEILERDKWITDGTYTRLLVKRFERTQMIVFLDMPRWRCMWRVLWRMISNYGKQHVFAPVGCYEGFSREFLSYVWNYKRDRRQMVLDLIEEAIEQGCVKRKHVHVLTSPKEVKEFLEKNGSTGSA